ncbi:MAG: DegT/DnrJ/EryC1/StrS family aminotransferase [Candidatus Hodarchaeota archaeon]
MKIPLSRPDINELDKEKVLEVLNTNNLSLGPKLFEFEKKFSDYIGTKYTIAVNSGTSGLHLCIKSLDLKYGDEVLTTPFSFIASANCILFERAKPVFVDIEEKTWNIDIDNLNYAIKKRKKNKKLKAILPVHIFGRPCNMNEIMDMAEEYELKVIEDSCEAIGAEYLTEKLANNKSFVKKEIWKKVGTFGDCGVFAFYPNKQITTGEGGMVVTDNENIFNSCKSMRNQGRSEDGVWLQHERLGYNYRLSDINCALGITQLERINEILTKREKVANSYNEKLKEIEGIITPQYEENKKISWFVYVIRLIDNYSQNDRDLILIKLKEQGIGCSHYFSPIHLQPFYRKWFGYKKGNFPVTERISERTIALPFYNNLKREEVDYVCENLKKIMKSF